MFKNKILNQIFSRSLIVFFNQISILLIISIIAIRFNFETFGHVGQAMILIQIGWIISNYGLMNYSIESKLKFKSSIFLSKFVSLAILQIFLFSIIIFYYQLVEFLK